MLNLRNLIRKWNETLNNMSQSEMEFLNSLSQKERIALEQYKRVHQYDTGGYRF